MKPDLRFLSICVLFLSTTGVAQIQNSIPPVGGGPVDIETHDELTPEQHAQIMQYIHHNIDSLRAIGQSITQTARVESLSFQFPLRWSDGFSGYGFDIISNYVDHDPAYPGAITDYNCGNRSYDTDAGYNHQGIDFALWPFDWNMMHAGAVSIIAAAPGQIVGKYDGGFDENCAFNPTNWNAIYVQHADGSVAWYGHMKKLSLTDKGLGAMVDLGEFLGLVGSSGNSTGPHLHFEVYDDADNLIDPFSGPCNDFNAESWWATQSPYIHARINRVQTHDAPPEWMTCPNDALIHDRDLYYPGETVYFAFYAADMANTDEAHLQINMPDGSNWSDWSFIQPDPYYLASYWYWSNILPEGPYGEWEFTVALAGTTYVHPFTLQDPLADVEDGSFFSDAQAWYAHGTIFYSVTVPASAETQIQVLDLQGRTVNSMPYTLVAGKQIIEIPVDNIASGMYVISIYSEKYGNESVKCVVN